MNFSWLPCLTQRLPATTRRKASWGCVIYRTTYTPQSDTVFPQIVDVLNSYIQDGLIAEHGSSQSHKLFGAEATSYNELSSQHPPVLMVDRTQFDGASTDSIRAHFLSWVENRQKRDNITMFSTCIVIDEEALRAFLDTSPPQEKSRLNSVRENPIRYVKVIVPSPEMDEYDSFMGGEYPGNGSDGLGIHSTSRAKNIPAWVESDDEYDSFLGG